MKHLLIAALVVSTQPTDTTALKTEQRLVVPGDWLATCTRQVRAFVLGHQIKSILDEELQALSPEQRAECHRQFWREQSK